MNKREKDLDKVRHLITQAWFLARDIEARSYGYEDYQDLFCRCLEGSDENIAKANMAMSCVSAATNLLREVLDTQP